MTENVLKLLGKGLKRMLRAFLMGQKPVFALFLKDNRVTIWKNAYLYSMYVKHTYLTF